MILISAHNQEKKNNVSFVKQQIRTIPTFSKRLITSCKKESNRTCSSIPTRLIRKIIRIKKSNSLRTVLRSWNLQQSRPRLRFRNRTKSTLTKSRILNSTHILTRLVIIQFVNTNATAFVSRFIESIVD